MKFYRVSLFNLMVEMDIDDPAERILIIRELKIVHHENAA